MATAELPTLRTGEAAALLGVHADTLREWADQELIRCWRTPSGHRRFRRSDVEALLSEPEEAAS